MLVPAQWMSGPSLTADVDTVAVGTPFAAPTPAVMLIVGVLAKPIVSGFARVPGWQLLPASSATTMWTLSPAEMNEVPAGPLTRNMFQLPPVWSDPPMASGGVDTAFNVMVGALAEVPTTALVEASAAPPKVCGTFSPGSKANASPE